MTMQTQPSSVSAERPVPKAVPPLKACILLSGSIKPSELVAGAACSVLDLYLTPHLTVLDAWLQRFQSLARAHGESHFVRVLHGGDTQVPAGVSAAAEPEGIAIECDRAEYRGPAGVVRDACERYAPDDLVLVAEAARYVHADLVPALAHHGFHASDVTVLANPDKSPAGLFILKVSTLALVPEVGFIDLKEQWLGKAVKSGVAVRAFTLDGCSYELRTRQQFLHAARVAASAVAVHADTQAGQRIIDSVVMPGAVIGADAVVARSILCAGAHVAAGEVVVDAIVPRVGVHSKTSLGRKGVRR